MTFRQLSKMKRRAIVKDEMVCAVEEGGFDELPEENADSIWKLSWIIVRSRCSMMDLL